MTAGGRIILRLFGPAYGEAYLLLALLGMATIPISVALAFIARIPLSDSNNGMLELIRTKPVAPADYVLGKFAGAFAIAVPLMLALAAGLEIAA